MAYRQRHRERRPLSGAGAFGRHFAPVRFDYVTHDRKAEPEPALLARLDAARLAEPLEYVRQEIGVDAVSAVPHLDVHRAIASLERQLDMSLARRELHGVREQ